jgi:hypothetical protein
MTEAAQHPHHLTAQLRSTLQPAQWAAVVVQACQQLQVYYSAHWSHTASAARVGRSNM